MAKIVDTVVLELQKSGKKEVESVKIGELVMRELKASLMLSVLIKATWMLP